MIDLHIHTFASDGQYTATEVVEMAGALGLSALAIADHNTVESVAEAEAAAAKAGIEFAPAFELDTIFRGRDLHILGYFIAYASDACRVYLDQIYQAKLEQTKKRVARLKELGFSIEFEELMKLSNWRLPTGKQFVEALVAREENRSDERVMTYVNGPRARSSSMNFYLDWLRAGRPAFVPLSEQPSEKAIAKIKSLSGVPVLAHPLDIPVEDVHALASHGLLGLEVYSSYHDAATSAKYLAVARDLKLLVTAGSDFHGPAVKADVKLAGIPGNDDRLFRELKKAAGR